MYHLYLIIYLFINSTCGDILQFCMDSVSGLAEGIIVKMAPCGIAELMVIEMML